MFCTSTLARWIDHPQAGDGTYANPHVFSFKTRLEYLIEYWQLIQSSGYEPQAEILSAEIEEASDEIADRLNIERNSPLLVTKLVLSADGNPAINVEDVIPIELIKEECDEQELKESFFDFLEDRCFVRLDYSVSNIEPCVCSEGVAEVLGLGPCTDRRKRPLYPSRPGRFLPADGRARILSSSAFQPVSISADKLKGLPHELA